MEDLFLEKPGESVSGMRFSQDGQVLAIALNNELVIRGYSVNDSKLLWEIPLHGGPIIKDFYWSKDQSVLVTLSMDRYLRTYDVALRRITTQIPLSIQEPKKLEIPLDEKAIFVLDTKGKIVRLPCLLESGN
jgi:WD40 repeat protein